MSLLSIANGFILPLGIPAAISIQPERSGSASGLVGFFQIFFSAFISSLVAKLFGTSSFVMSSTIVLLCISSISLYLFSVKSSNIRINL